MLGFFTLWLFFCLASQTYSFELNFGNILSGVEKLASSYKFIDGLVSSFIKNPIIPFQASYVPEDQVEFHLFTRNNPLDSVILNQSNAQIVNDGKVLKIIIHGWQNTIKDSWVVAMMKAYLKKGDYNVLVIDWSKPAGKIYIEAAQDTNVVGRFLGDLILKSGVHLDKVHLIGHSLGAQVAGFAGKRTQSEGSGKIGRITGLDPAGLLFEGVSLTAERLSPGDATMVDVVHTDSGKFGLEKPAGTLDFYPNGGFSPQPGCPRVKERSQGLPRVEERSQGFPRVKKTSQVIPRMEERIGDSLVDAIACSHFQSFRFFIASINNPKYYGVKCFSWAKFLRGACANNEKVVFGEDAPSWATGSFYLNIDISRSRKTKI